MSKSSFNFYVASPGVYKKRENRASRYKREHAHRATLSGPPGEVGNEQLRYSTGNSEGDEYPRKKKILYWARICTQLFLYILLFFISTLFSIALAAIPRQFSVFTFSSSSSRVLISFCAPFDALAEICWGPFGWVPLGAY